MRSGLIVGVASGAVLGLADCIRVGSDATTILTPDHWLGVTVLYTLIWAALGGLGGLAAGVLFRRAERAAVLICVLGTVGFAVAAMVHFYLLPHPVSPEAFRFDAVLAVSLIVAFLAVHFLPVPVPTPRVRVVLVLVAVLLLAAFAAPWFVGNEAEEEIAVEVAPGGRPNVLVVLVDTLRADHLGAYGYARPTSPNFDSLAAGSTLFTRCRSTSSWTKPSTASIHTGLVPSAHGAHEQGQVLSERAVTLAEVFRAAGYRTAGFSDNTFISPEFGFGQGFDRFESTRASVFINGTLVGRALWALRIFDMAGRLRRDANGSEIGAEGLLRQFFAWLDEDADGGQPWFGYVHAIEPHTPYAPPEPFRGRFADPEYDGPDHRDTPAWKGFLPFRPGPELPEAERRHIVDRYDEEILAMDAALGGAVEELRRRGQLEKSILVVVSDHGEEFYEHGGWKHGRSLYEEQIRVPFLIRVPGVTPRRIESPVRALDIYPTLFGLTGLTPQVDMPRFGEDLTECIRTGRPPREAPTISEVHHGGRSARSIVDREKKLIRSRRMSEDVTQAFDLDADPAERNSIDAAKWAKRHGRRLEQTLRAAESVALPSRTREITPEERDALRGLGYID